MNIDELNEKLSLNPLKNGVVFRQLKAVNRVIAGMSQSPEERGGLPTNVEITFPEWCQSLNPLKNGVVFRLHCG